MAKNQLVFMMGFLVALLAPLLSASHAVAEGESSIESCILIDAALKYTGTTPVCVENMICRETTSGVQLATAKVKEQGGCLPIKKRDDGASECPQPLDCLIDDGVSQTQMQNVSDYPKNADPCRDPVAVKAHPPAKSQGGTP